MAIYRTIGLKINEPIDWQPILCSRFRPTHCDPTLFNLCPMGDRDYNHCLSDINLHFALGNYYRISSDLRPHATNTHPLYNDCVLCIVLYCIPCGRRLPIIFGLASIGIINPAWVNKTEYHSRLFNYGPATTGTSAKSGRPKSPRRKLRITGEEQINNHQIRVNKVQLMLRWVSRESPTPGLTRPPSQPQCKYEHHFIGPLFVNATDSISQSNTNKFKNCDIWDGIRSKLRLMMLLTV